MKEGALITMGEEQINKTKEIKMNRTNTAWDPYMKYLLAAINDSRYMKRAENKPMMTPRKAKESHLTSRASHLRQSADIAKRIADALNLNSDLVYIAMLMHDAGHTFSGHEGEQYFSELNDYYNGQFFHHNSKGVEIITKEAILDNAIARIPDMTPELEKSLREDFYEFLDIIISHDGEVSQGEMSSIKTKTNLDIGDSTMREKVLEKTMRANTSSKPSAHKFMPERPEGFIGKYSDVIAYLGSDIQDAFRTGLLTEFDDEYLEIFGKMIIRKEAGFPEGEVESTREERIAKAKLKITEIQEQKLMETISDAKTETNRPLITISKEISNLIKQLEEPRKKKAREVVDKKIAAEGITNQDEEQKRRRELLDEYLKNNPVISNEENEDFIQIGISYYRRAQQVVEKMVATENITNSDELRKRKMELLNQYLKEHSLAESEEYRRYKEEGYIENPVKEERGKNKRGTYQIDEKLLMAEAEETKIRQFTDKFVSLPGEVIQSLTQQIQEFCIEDIIHASQGKSIPIYSDEGLSLISELKRKDMRAFVKFSKLEYQNEIYPQVVRDAVKLFSNNILKTGIVRDRFYDPDIRDKITDEDAKSKMKAHYYSYRKKGTGDAYRRHIESMDQDRKGRDFVQLDLENLQQEERKLNLELEKLQNEENLDEYTKLRRIRYKEEEIRRNQRKQRLAAPKAQEYSQQIEDRFTRKIMTYIGKEGENFINKYMHTYQAVATRVRDKIEFALEGKEPKNMVYREMIEEQFAWIRSDYNKRFLKENPEGTMEDYIQEQTERERDNMEYKMIEELVSDYLAGMTDTSFMQLVVDLGLTSKKEIDERSVRGSMSSNVKKIEEENEAIDAELSEAGDGER